MPRLLARRSLLRVIDVSGIVQLSLALLRWELISLIPAESGISSGVVLWVNM
jgi:hypothetical protein